MYISQMSPYLMGNMVKRSSLGSSRGSATRFSSVAFSATIFAVTAVCACVRRGVRVRYDDARGRKSFGRTCRRVEEWLEGRRSGCTHFRRSGARGCVTCRRPSQKHVRSAIISTLFIHTKQISSTAIRRTGAKVRSNFEKNRLLMTANQ